MGDGSDDLRAGMTVQDRERRTLGSVIEVYDALPPLPNPTPGTTFPGADTAETAVGALATTAGMAPGGAGYLRVAREELAEEPLRELVIPVSDIVRVDGDVITLDCIAAECIDTYSRTVDSLEAGTHHDPTW